MKPDRKQISNRIVFTFTVQFLILWRILDQVFTALKIAHIYQSKVRKSVLNSLGGDAQGV